MAGTANAFVTPQTPNCTVQNFVQGTDVAGTYKTIYTAGAAPGTKIVGINVATDDGSASHVLTLVLTRSAVNYYIGAYTLPVNSGTDGATAAVDLMRGGPSTLIPSWPVDNDGQRFGFMASGDTLRMTFATALTAGKRIDVLVTAGDFV